MKRNYEGHSIYAGIDVHKKNWAVAIYSSRAFHKKMTQPPSAQFLVRYLERHFPGAKYYSVYESGFCGFYPHRELESLGINNIVVNAADVPTGDKERKRKSDRSDCVKLALALRAGQLHGSYIPDEEQENDRQLVRTRFAIQKDLRRVKNRIRGVINQYHLQALDQKKWSKKFIRLLKSQKLPGAQLQCSWDLMINQIEYLMNLRNEADKSINALSEQIRFIQSHKLLTGIPGIGSFTAMVFLCEIGHITRFRSAQQFNSYVGIVPNQYASGEKNYQTRMTDRQNKYLKSVLIQAAWRAKSVDPSLLMSYEELVKRMPASKAIVRIARKLLNRIYHVLKKQEAYQLGY